MSVVDRHAVDRHAFDRKLNRDVIWIPSTNGSSSADYFFICRLDHGQPQWLRFHPSRARLNADGDGKSSGLSYFSFVAADPLTMKDGCDERAHFEFHRFYDPPKLKRPTSLVTNETSVPKVSASPSDEWDSGLQMDRLSINAFREISVLFGLTTSHSQDIWYEILTHVLRCCLYPPLRVYPRTDVRKRLIMDLIHWCRGTGPRALYEFLTELNKPDTSRRVLLPWPDLMDVLGPTRYAQLMTLFPRNHAVLRHELMMSIWPPSSRHPKDEQRLGDASAYDVWIKRWFGEAAGSGPGPGPGPGSGSGPGPDHYWSWPYGQLCFPRCTKLCEADSRHTDRTITSSDHHWFHALRIAVDGLPKPEEGLHLSGVTIGQQLIASGVVEIYVPDTFVDYMEETLEHRPDTFRALWYTVGFEMQFVVDSDQLGLAQLPSENGHSARVWALLRRRMIETMRDILRSVGVGKFATIHGLLTLIVSYLCPA